MIEYENKKFSDVEVLKLPSEDDDRIDIVEYEQKSLV